MSLLGARLKLLKRAAAQAAYLDDHIDSIIRYHITKQKMLDRILNVDEQGLKTNSSMNNGIVVSLTTHGRRIHTVPFSIESLFLQTRVPDRIVLYLSKEEFSIETLPFLLRNQIKRGLEVRFVEDLGPYTKLLPALHEFPDSIIVTIDDDYMYPVDLIERLSNANAKHPEAVCCCHSRIIQKKNGIELMPYDSFEMSFPKEDLLSHNLLAEGFGGILYPPGSFTDKVFDKKCINDLSPYADDLWFKAMELIAGTPVLQVARGRDWFSSMTSEKSVQDSGLARYNNEKKGNDKQLKALFSHFDLFGSIE